MNNLSWFLYLADIVGGLGVIFTFFSTFFTIGMLIISSISIGCYIEEDPFPHKLNYLWFVTLLFCALAIFIPSKNTIYAIAASELGEDAYKSALGQKSVQAIEAWIASQLPTKKEQ